MTTQPETPANVTLTLLLNYGCMFLWIFLSAAVILVNKYVLAYSGFPYPIALTCTHMAFCSVLAWTVVKAGLEQATPISADLYIKGIIPIGVLFAGTLWMGNAAYLSLSVSFIQMLKASMPMVVFITGVLLKTEKFTLDTGINMIVVVTGICIASYGEVHFVVIGVILQCASLLTEALRLTLVQILLQSRGVKLNPISTLCHVAPCCFVFLFLPFIYLELPKIWVDPDVKINVPLLLASASIAFGLNYSVFLLIGRTSALTMNVAGVVKDWLLICLSVLMFKSTVTLTQVGGYGLAFLGVAWYNYVKVKAMRQAAAGQTKVDKVEKPNAEVEDPSPRKRVDVRQTGDS